MAGVYEDLPHNTTLRDVAFIATWDYYAAFHDWVRRALDNWGENSFQLYVQVADNADMAKISEKIRDIKLKNVDKEDAKYKPVIFLQPMSKWHLYAEFRNGVNTGGAIEYAWLFGLIGIFVLLPACINNEERIGRLAGFFAMLAIFISCPGLFGMATFMAEQRIKEIGVPKVLGASVVNLWGLLSKDFVALVVISLFIAIPVAYYFMGNWLRHYEYHADMRWWVFAVAGAGTMLITVLTVSFQSMNAALMKPVESLRAEG